MKNTWGGLKSVQRYKIKPKKQHFFIGVFPGIGNLPNFALSKHALMLQRIQTVYLAIGAIACIALYFFPLANFYNEVQGNYKFFICHIQSMDPEPKLNFSIIFSLPAIILTLASIIFSISTIFLFKKRWLQLRLISFNVITLTVLILVLFFFYTAQLKTTTGADPEYTYPGMLLPVLSLVMLILANRAIRKDEQRVRSADRLR